MPRKAKGTHPLPHSGTIIFCTDRRKSLVHIGNAMKNKGVGAATVAAVRGSYAHENAGNRYEEPALLSKMELGFHPEHPGTHFSVIGHDGGCGGMKLMHSLMKAEREGRGTRSLLKDPVFGATYREIANDLPLYRDFLEKVQQAKGGRFDDFFQGENFRKALEEFNVFLQLSRTVHSPHFQRHNETVRRVHGRDIVTIGGIYTPKERMVGGKHMPVQGSIRFEYKHLQEAVGGKRKLDALLREMGLRYTAGNPEVKRTGRS